MEAKRLNIKRSLKYLAVAAIMFSLGFILGFGLGFVAGYTVAWSSQLTGGPVTDLTSAGYSQAFTLALPVGMLFALTVFIGNPIANFLDKIAAATEAKPSNSDNSTEEKK